MPFIIIENGSPDFTEQEALESLAASLRSQVNGIDVVIASPTEQRGYAVTLWEVLQLWVPWEELQGAAAALLVAEVKNWVKGRLEKARAEDEEAEKENPKVWHTVRPTAVIIYGPDGEALAVVEQEGKDLEPRVGPDKLSRKRLRPKVE